MNKNIFRALLLGAGAVIAAQQAEAHLVMGNLSGAAVKEALAKIGQNNNNSNTPLPQGGAPASLPPSGGADQSGTSVAEVWLERVKGKIELLSDICWQKNIDLLSSASFTKQSNDTTEGVEFGDKLLKNFGVLYSADKNNLSKKAFDVAEINYDEKISTVRQNVKDVLEMISEQKIDQAKIFESYSVATEGIIAMLALAIPDTSKKPEQVAKGVEVVALAKYLAYSLAAASETLGEKSGVFYKTLKEKAENDKSFALRHNVVVRCGEKYDCVKTGESYDKDSGVLDAYKKAQKKLVLQGVKQPENIKKYKLDLSNK